MADLEIRAFGWRFFAVFERTGKVRTASEELVLNLSGDFEPAEPADALYQDPYEQETDVRFGFSG